MCVCNFTCRPDETYALVGTAKDLTLNPRSCAGGFIHAYRITELIDGGYKLEFVHKVNTSSLTSRGFVYIRLVCDTRNYFRVVIVILVTSVVCFVLDGG